MPGFDCRQKALCLLKCAISLCACAGGGAEVPQESGKAIEYRAPFVLPWIVIQEAMATQPESFVPFTAGAQGAPFAFHHSSLWQPFG